jgi:uncharacterized protein YjaG (DUF416 family)
MLTIIFSNNEKNENLYQNCINNFLEKICIPEKILFENNLDVFKLIFEINDNYNDFDCYGELQDIVILNNLESVILIDYDLKKQDEYWHIHGIDPEEDIWTRKNLD